MNELNESLPDSRLQIHKYRKNYMSKIRVGWCFRKKEKISSKVKGLCYVDEREGILYKFRTKIM